ncbi:MAG: hypothetical protein HY898_30940 [Deltaproteobacteria bacterium]|nr:hypothetical protein [Deltaproteobacteria bacterium]
MRTGSLLLLGAIVVGCSSSDSAEPATPGDTRAQALAYATDNLPCATEADCCVVFDGCKGKGLIVAAKDKTKVAELLAQAPNDVCVGCIPPYVQVKCVSSVCSGVSVHPGSGADYAAGAPFNQSHCGTVPLPTGWTEQQSVPVGSSPGLNPSKVLGCGD